MFDATSEDIKKMKEFFRLKNVEIKNEFFRHMPAIEHEHTLVWSRKYPLLCELVKEAGTLEAWLFHAESCGKTRRSLSEVLNGLLKQ